MKLKIDEQGNVVVVDGKPVYVDENGQEVPFDVPAALAKITELNRENKDRRLANKELEEKLAKYADLDPEESRKALEIVKNLETKKLIDAGEVEKVKKGISDGYEAKLAQKEQIIAAKDAHIYKLEVSNRFANSKFIVDKLSIPPDLTEAYFGKNFKIEDNRVVAYINEDKIYSKIKPGELADFEEALAELVNTYPQKDKIMKGTGATGTGATTTFKKITTPADTSHLSAIEKLKIARREQTQEK